MATDAFKHAVEIETKLRIISSAQLKSDLANISKQIAEALSKQETYENFAKNFAFQLKKEINNAGTRIQGTDSAGETGKQEGKKGEQLAKSLGSISNGMQTISTTGMSVLKTSLGILTDVFERIKAASPLLQAIESIFNLAMQLFFMPLGTKLATVLIPSVTALVDDVMQIWDGFEGKSLGQILEDTISIGVDAFGEYFSDIGETLSSQGGILGSIGNMISLIGSLITNRGEEIIKKITSILSFIVSHIPEILGAIFAFMAVSKALQLAQIAVMMAINWKTAIAGAAALAGVAAVGVWADNTAKNWAETAADGGYFPATPGGTQVLIAEGGEGETVVPDSKKVDFAKSVIANRSPEQPSGQTGNTYNIYVNGYTDSDLSDKIVRVLNEQNNLSMVRSGY